MGIRVSDLTRILERDCQVTVEKPKRGSHWKLRRPGYRPYTLPANNGDKTEVSDKYIASMCDELDLSEDFIRGKLGIWSRPQKKKKKPPPLAGFAAQSPTALPETSEQHQIAPPHNSDGDDPPEFGEGVEPVDETQVAAHNTGEVPMASGDDETCG